MRPPMVKHKGRRCTPEEMEELVGACGDNIHLTSGGKRLLLFYATCYGGFRPAKRLIQRETGINPAHLYGYKKELQDLGLLSIEEGTRAIYVDWQRIRLYSTLESELTNRHRKNTTISDGVHFTGRKIGTLNARYIQRAVGRPLTSGQRHFYDTVDNMTESEWNAMVWAMGTEIPEPIEIPEAEQETTEILVPVEPEYKNYYGEIHLPF